jgi:hypothetical protein
MTNIGRPECQPAALRRRADQWLAGHDAVLPAPPPDALARMRADGQRLGYPDFVADLVWGIGAAGILEGVFWEEFLAGVPGPVADAARRCVLLFCARTGELNAVVGFYPGEGALIRLDWALLLMWSWVLQHALSAMTESEHEGILTITVADPPADATVRALASLIWSFRQPSRGFRELDVPALTSARYTGERAFGKLLWFGEQFLIGHEVAHGLVRAGGLSEAPGVREAVHDWFDLDPATEDNWVSEISADAAALGWAAYAAGADAPMRGVAAAAGLVVMSFIGFLERSLVVSPAVPFPLDANSPASAFAGLRHPPAELRAAMLRDQAELFAGAITIAAPYQDAIDQLQSALMRSAGGRCIATAGTASWCGQERGPRGWLCAVHGSAG